MEYSINVFIGRLYLNGISVHSAKTVIVSVYPDQVGCCSLLFSAIYLLYLIYIQAVASI